MTILSIEAFLAERPTIEAIRILKTGPFYNPCEVIISYSGPANRLAPERSVSEADQRRMNLAGFGPLANHYGFLDELGPDCAYRNAAEFGQKILGSCQYEAWMSEREASEISKAAGANNAHHHPAKRI
jgi:hypothetical protein